MNEQNVGTVSQVIGPVLDVKFADGQPFPAFSMRWK